MPALAHVGFGTFRYALPARKSMSSRSHAEALEALCVLSCACGQLCFCTVRHGRTLSVSVPALQRLAAAPATVAPRSLCTRGRFLQRTTFRAMDPPALTQTDGFLVSRAPLGMTRGRKLVDGRLADVLAQRHALTAGARYVHSVWHAIIAMPSLRVVSN